MSSGEKRLNGLRCSGTTRAGKPCQALAGSDGLCSAHNGTQDMRELGRKGAKARRQPNPERVQESLRSYLKCEVAPAEVWQALRQAMTCANESARVSASRLLLDALAEPDHLEDVDRGAHVAAYREKLARLLTDRVARTVGLEGEMAARIEKLEGRRQTLIDECEQLEAKLGDLRAQRGEFVAT